MNNTNTWGLRLIPRLIRPGYFLVQLLFLVFFTFMGVGATPLWTQVFAGLVSCIYLLNMHANRWDAYRALNLPAWLYDMHRQLLAFVTLLIIVPLGLVLNATTQAGFPWIWLIGLAAGMLHLLVGGSVNPWQSAARVEDKREQKDQESKVSSPVGEIIRKPQWMLWGGIWGATAIAVVVTIILDYVDGDGIFAGARVPNNLFTILPVFLFMFLFFFRVADDSLRRWVAFGGDRRTWSRETRRIIVANSGIGAAVAGIFAFLIPAASGEIGDFETFAGMAGILIAVPPAFFAVQFLSANRTVLLNGVTILLALAVWTGPIYIGDDRLLLLVAAIVLIWWAVTLEYQARERNVFRASGFATGIQAFFGTARTA